MGWEAGFALVYVSGMMAVVGDIVRYTRRHGEAIDWLSLAMVTIPWPVLAIVNFAEALQEPRA